MNLKNIAIIIFLLLCFQVLAEIKVASVLGDNMILQRNTEVSLWGKSKPNEKLTINTGWNNAKIVTLSNERGDWKVKVKTADAGGPYTIKIATQREKVVLNNILLGEVWLCSGQSNMEMPVAGFNDQPVNGSNDMLVDAENNNIRLFTLQKASVATPQDTCVGKWEIATAESVARFSAVGYLYAKQLQQKLRVPVGMICSSWGGSRIEAWMSKESISKFPEALRQTTQEKTMQHQRASQLYNGMIAPIINYTIKGAIWYQGESNIDNYTDYAVLMTEMVANWRNEFGMGDFPFYYVQIAPFSYKNKINSALQRDQQKEAMAMIPNSGMVSTIDIGEEKIIHPAEKETVAKRLAYWAFAETYGVKGISYKSPTFKSMMVKDSVVLLTFDNIVNGLTTFGKEVECFEVAGQDSVFYSAKMSIYNKQVSVWSPQVKTPVAVSYAFRNYPATKGFLYNTAGLPVLSFRTDNWMK